MKIYKILIIIFIIFFLIFLLATTLYNKTKLNYNVVKYMKNINIFIDRDYVDKSKIKFFYGKTLIQIPRHFNKKILILTNSELIIYRPTCIDNQNQIYKTNWKLMNLSMQVKGFSCLHNKIYFKEFNNSLFFLNSGGPVSSDPILIELKNKNGFFKILNKNE